MNKEGNQTDPYTKGKKYGYHSYMVERFVELLGEDETSQLLLFNETKLNKNIRLNSLRSAPHRTVDLLQEKKVRFKTIEGIPEALEITESPIPIGATPEYLNGFYILQGKNSMLPAKVLNPSKDDLVGDFAAAPGGKTSHLAQIMNNNGIILALELSSNRCRSLKSNLERMGVKNTIVMNFDTRKAPGLNLKFDKILLDAPCSGSGIIISDSTRKKSKTLEDIKNYHDYQVELLNASLECLKSGGELVYCTCSLEPEENEHVITKAFDSHEFKIQNLNIKGDPGLEAFKEYEYHPEVKKAKRIYPHKSNGEGFFIIKMVKA